MAFTIDVDENKWNEKILQVLLSDMTTKRNIIWGTDDYEELGTEYNSRSQILIHLITGFNSQIIQPRVLKTKENQGNRTKKKAEVFTPSWVCNEQNNLVDNIWFSKTEVFNKAKNKKWTSSLKKIEFPNDKNKTWKSYVDDKRLEITCGEAPYLVSRYDSVTGEIITLNQRIGLLDRKMRVISENVKNEREWLKWTERAYQSIYGFEFHGDSLLIARENLLISYCDYMEDKLKRVPTEKELLRIAKIISWNIWQMDGLTYTIPYQRVEKLNVQLTFFDSYEEKKNMMCLIKDWRTKKVITFKDLLNKGDIENGEI